MARARAANPHLNAVAHWFDDPVRTEVVVPDDAPLAGIPTFIKDNEEVAGFPTTQGSRAVPDIPAPACSPIVAALLGLGLEPLGATHHARVRADREHRVQPLRPDAQPLGPDAHLRRVQRRVGSGRGLPHGASGPRQRWRRLDPCPGVLLRPVRTQANARPGTPVGPDIAEAWQGMAIHHVLSRSVRDTALLLALTDPARPDAGLPPIGHVTRPGTERLRIGMCVSTLRGLPLSPDTVAAVRGAGALFEDLGHHVEEVGPPVGEEFATDFLRYWALLAFVLHRSGSAAYGKGFDGTQVEEFTRGLSKMLNRQIDRVPGSIRRLRQLSHNPDAGFEKYDLFLSPVTGYPAPPIGFLGPDVEFRTHLVRLIQFASMTPVQNVSGAPAMSLPLGRSAEGRPIGVHLAAPFGHERRLLEVALELEQAAPWPVQTTPSGAASGATDVVRG